ncbi:MFS transporter [Candidatus Berkiella aquae]|uniref:Bicyclomycin resistance protein n=1 Tax=Candidatus Berkiella aquae TaxID=295108 RepID=A0A0Q9YD21_9GAMM|nr:multidrug effflux MFS transporter [Candidatus Berkiella aquae]MCS5709908.1 multidrug effflux MFS transporter [Candidatus Berkiella aquae]
MKPYFQSKAQELSFIGIVLFAFIAFYVETDIYTPTFPAMMSYFATNEQAIQLLISMNFLGLCLSSLFFGPASDAYGRKAILCTGLFIFMLGSFGCSLTSSFAWMVFYRLLQGLGCGAIVSAGLAMFFDVFTAEKSARLVALCNGLVGGLMALAPMIGNWIGLRWGWRVNFYLIAALVTLVFFAYLFYIKETLPKEKRTPLRVSTICRNYASLLSNFPFVAHNMIWCLTFSVIIVFIANLSLIFIDYLQVDKKIFGYYQASIMGAFFVGSLAGARLIKTRGMFRTKMIGNGFYLVGIMSLSILSFSHNESPNWLIASMTLASFGCAAAITISFSYSMNFIGDNLKGSAMSLTQSLRLLLTSGLIWIAAHYFDGSTIPMSLLAIVSSGISISLYACLYKRGMHFVRQTSITA